MVRWLADYDLTIPFLGLWRLPMGLFLIWCLALYPLWWGLRRKCQVFAVILLLMSKSRVPTKTLRVSIYVTVWSLISGRYSHVVFSFVTRGCYCCCYSWNYFYSETLFIANRAKIFKLYLITLRSWLLFSLIDSPFPLYITNLDLSVLICMPYMDDVSSTFFTRLEFFFTRFFSTFVVCKAKDCDVATSDVDCALVFLNSARA